MDGTQNAVMDFLKTRRSRPAKTLTGPAPGTATLRALLEAAARVPDHGKLEPWRFIVLSQPALARLADLCAPCGARLGKSEEDIAKAQAMYRDAPICVAVIASPKPSEKIPEFEQLLSAGAACLSLLNAALASGWGANWLSGWASHDPEFCAEGLGLAPQERIAGLIVIGTETSKPPERPRPDLDAITSWVEE